MSLYADEDLSTVQELDNAVGVAGPADPLQALAAALTCPAESSAQAEALVAAGQRFEEHPEKLPDLCGHLLPMVVDGGESLLRSWTLDMVALAVGRSALKVDVKLAVAQSSLEALSRLLASDSVPTIKAVIPIFSTIHSSIFKLLASSRPPPGILDPFQSAKSRIFDLVLDPNSRPQNVGIKATGWKFIQKVLLVGTRIAGADPRLARTSSSVDPTISIIMNDSPLDAVQMEKEAEMLRTELITQLYTADHPAILHPIINILPLLCKSRPSLAPLIVSAITTWTPAAMMNANRPAMQVRAVEKTMKCVISHLVRYPPLAAYSAQFKAASIAQKGRMEPAFITEQAAREARRATRSDQVLGKHPLPEAPAESSSDAAKRIKTEAESAPTSGLGFGKGPEIDVTSLNLPLQTIIELVIANLEIISTDILERAFLNARKALSDKTADAQPLLATALGVSVIGGDDTIKEEDLDEILNPLDMDMEDDDELLLAATQEDETEEILTFADFRLPTPEPLPPSEKDEMVEVAVQRIWTSGGELAGLPDVTLPPSDGVKLAVQPKEIWMLLLARLATRGADVKRNVISDFVVADFASRSKFASIWLNEEWYNEKLNPASPKHYTLHLAAILNSYLPKIDGRDKSLSAFLMSLPELPEYTIKMLESLCSDPERNIVGFLALRDLVETRPPVRQAALNVLLELCTHDDRKIRVLAISTVRRWVPGSAMSDQVVAYAKGVLQRLATASNAEGEDVDMKPSISESEGQDVNSKYLKSVSPDTVQQHVELFLALSRRHQPLLDQIFQLFPQLSPTMQDALEPLFTPLIQSLGASEKLLDILQHFPIGADRLALRVVSVLSGEGRREVVGVVKALMVERELDPRFIIPIIGQLDKSEIEGQLPRIVSLLSDNDNRDMVRNAFASALQKMRPADLLVSLHNEDTALKQTIEAIGLCFSMTTVFRSDVLSAAMSRIADLPSLPIVFIRTIIQAVSTYKSLTPFVANHIFPKLIAKKIWENSQLWDGFVRLARRISPACFGALMQVPKEWLKDLVDRQPAMRGALKSFLAGKPGTRDVMYEIFGDE